MARAFEANPLQVSALQSQQQVALSEQAIIKIHSNSDARSFKGRLLFHRKALAWASFPAS